MLDASKNLNVYVLLPRGGGQASLLYDRWFGVQDSKSKQLEKVLEKHLFAICL